jgi:hypothetical protein
MLLVFLLWAQQDTFSLTMRGSMRMLLGGRKRRSEALVLGGQSMVLLDVMVQSMRCVDQWACTMWLDAVGV